MNAETTGTTKVLGCCTFVWREADGVRLVEVHAAHHDRCVEELSHAAILLGVRLKLVASLAA